MAKRPPSLRPKPKRPVSNWALPSRKSASERGYGAEWKKQRARIMLRDKRLCQPCLRKALTTVANEVDHIIPRARGGTEDDSNLQAICIPCHKVKTAREGSQGLSRTDRVRVRDY